MFVIDIAIHIMDRKVAQGNAAAHSLILCHHSHASAVHFMRSTVIFPQDFHCLIANLNIMDDHMLYII